MSFHHKCHTVRKLHFFKSFGLSVSYSSSSSRTHHYRVSTKICAIVHQSPMSYLHCDHVQPCANAVVTKKNFHHSSWSHWWTGVFCQLSRWKINKLYRHIEWRRVIVTYYNLITVITIISPAQITNFTVAEK